jgi:hypothetical protein
MKLKLFMVGYDQKSRKIQSSDKSIKAFSFISVIPSPSTLSAQKACS